MGKMIDEAITRYKNNAEYERTHGNLQGCLEFRQLAEWLEQYQELKAQYEARLKADMVAMLSEILTDFDTLVEPNSTRLDCESIIEQKIEILKERTDGEN